MAESTDLDATIRRADPDRWLASRFIADATARADVVAVYAFDHELARVAEVVHEPLMAEIRLAWWREALEDIFAGKSARGHPVLSALAAAIARQDLARAPLEAMVEARFQDLERARFADAAALENHVDATVGAVMALAVAVLARADAAALRPAAQAWGLIGLLRQWDLGGADRFPQGWDRAMVAERARAVLASARRPIAALPVPAFPAVAHLALARPYLAGRRPSDLEKRLRVTGAVLLGRV